MSNFSDLGEVRYPECFIGEDLLSNRKQRRHRRTVLFVGATAVLLEVLSWFTGLIATGAWHVGARVLFSIAIGFLGWELLVSSSKKLEVPWYDARAAAESIKTVFWRYLTQAEPFGSTKSRTESEEQLYRRIEEVLRGLGKTPQSRDLLVGSESLDWAWAARTAPLAKRIDLYVRSRVADQKGWYVAKSATLRVYARRASAIAILAAFVALVLSIVSFWNDSAGGWSEVSFEVSVVVFGYASIRNYSRDSRVYEFTAQEIESAASQIHSGLSQQEWAELVDEIEEVFSREHVTWQASHSGEIRRPKLHS